MADEAIVAIGTTATLTPLIEIRYNGIHQLTSAEVIQKINEYVSHNKQIDLFLFFERLRFDSTGAMQKTIVENSRHIKKITIYNGCDEKEEHLRCFIFFTKIVRGIIGKGKHLTYYSYEFEFELEQANQLADSFRQLNNNNNDAIESFDFHDDNLTPVTFQTLLDALLVTGVRKITFGNDDTADPPINYNNSNINFTVMEANKSLEHLDLNGFDIREEDYQSLFNSMKVNKGVEKLILNYVGYRDLPTRMKRLFKQMLRENITLQDCSFSYCNGEDDPIFEMIQFHTKVNRMMKRYIKKRNTKSTVATMPARAGVATRTRARTRASTVEATNKKKRLKMRMFLNLFIHKPVLRDSIIFNLLRDYPDDMMGTDFHRLMDVHDRDDDDRGNNNRDDGTDGTL